MHVYTTFMPPRKSVHCVEDERFSPSTMEIRKGEIYSWKLQHEYPSVLIWKKLVSDSIPHSYFIDEISHLGGMSP